MTYTYENELNIWIDLFNITTITDIKLVYKMNNNSPLSQDNPDEPVLEQSDNQGSPVKIATKTASVRVSMDLH